MLGWTEVDVGWHHESFHLSCLQLGRNLSGAVLSAVSMVEMVQPNETDSLVKLVSVSVSHLLQLPTNSPEITTVAQVSWLK